MRARTEQVAGRALRAPEQCPGRKLACAGGAVCCGKETKKAPAKPPARTCVIVLHKRERQLAAPRRRRDSPGTGPRTCFHLSIKRGASRRSKARIDSGGTPPVRGRTGQAGFLPAARPERTQQNHRRGREASARSGAALSRRPKARIAQREHPPRTCFFLSIKRERQLAAQGANRPVRSRTADVR